MAIGLAHYLAVGAVLFAIGIFGIFLNRKNVIVILMSVELMLLAVNINFVAFSAHLGDLVGQIFAMFVLGIAAADTGSVVYAYTPAMDGRSRHGMRPHHDDDTGWASERCRFGQGGY